MKIKLIIIAFLFSYACILNHNKLKIVGSWNACSPDGLYIELHIKKDFLLWCPELEPLGIKYKYQLQRNKLTSYSLVKKDEIREGIINLVNGNLILVYNSEKLNDTLIFTPIVSQNGFEGILSIDINSKESEDMNEYLKKYYERLNEKKCKRKETLLDEELFLIPIK